MTVAPQPKSELGTLIIFSGLPGSGKSTLASKLTSKLSATYLRIDTIEQGMRDICGIKEVQGEGYRLSYRIARENLALGNNVIADSVNPWGLTRKEWNDVAAEIGAPYINVEVVCSDKLEHRQRVETRLSSVLGLKLPTWKEVEERDYHAWDDDTRIVIETSGRDLIECLDELMSKLSHLQNLV